MKQCIHCFKTKPIHAFPLDNNRKTTRGNCKKCHSAQQQGNFYRRKMKEKPRQYVECDDCDAIMSIYTAQRPRQINCCKKCESENLFYSDGTKYENPLFY